jgi:leader peptidase (prepilin peptidase)/N-methyltransferase
MEIVSAAPHENGVNNFAASRLGRERRSRSRGGPPVSAAGPPGARLIRGESRLDPDTRALFIAVAAFAFGAVIGSFLNVVIYRLPRADEGLSLTKPRLSLCPHCGVTIHWYDNVPLLSYFLLRGRCRACKAPISIRYFLVELLTAALFTLLAMRVLGRGFTAEGAARLAVLATLTAALVAVTFIDIEFRIIPDRIDLPGIALAPLISVAVPSLHLGHRDLETLGVTAALDPRAYAAFCSLLGIVAGGGVIFLIGVLGTLAFKKEAMGLGDVKLLAMIGGFLGWKGALLALLLACFAGAAIGIVVKLLTKDPYIPFGPFLALGALFVILWREEILEFLFVTYPSLFRPRGGDLMPRPR